MTLFLVVRESQRKPKKRPCHTARKLNMTSVDSKVEELLQQMTLEEKLGQLVWPLSSWVTRRWYSVKEPPKQRITWTNITWGSYSTPLEEKKQIHFKNMQWRTQGLQLFLHPFTFQAWNTCYLQYWCCSRSCFVPWCHSLSFSIRNVLYLVNRGSIHWSLNF